MDTTQEKFTLRFTPLENVVTDTASGLMWTKNAALEPFPVTWPEALAFVRSMNEQTMFGYSDWRVPNRRELFSLISHDDINPALPQGHPFSDVFNGYYWSSTTCRRLPDQAWYVHLGGARVFKGMKHRSYMVWPVRTADSRNLHIHRTGQQTCYGTDGGTVPCSGSGQDGDIRAGQSWPNPRYEINANAVTDRMTGLIWDRTADRTGIAVTWNAALAEVHSANIKKLHGFSDWRLPDVRELESLCDMDAYCPALSRFHPFTGLKNFYWSATTSRYDCQYAWTLYLEDGAVGVGFKPLSEFFVWLVRNR
jgi:hypothetical protein